MSDWNTQKTTSGKLVLHCGANLLTGRHQLAAAGRLAVSPAGHAFWKVSHEQLLAMVEDSLDARGYAITDERHALTPDGNRYFGLLDVRHRDNPSEGIFSGAVGVRNSLDGTVAPQGVACEHVFICDNMAMSGTRAFARKQTRFVLRDLPGRVDAGIGEILGMLRQDALDAERARDYGFERNEAEAFFVEALRRDVVNGTQLRNALGVYEAPEFEEYGRGTLWTAKNAITHVLRGIEAGALTRRTLNLSALVRETLAARN